MAPFATKATKRTTYNDFAVCLNSSPVNVGRSARTRNRNVDRRCVRFRFQFFNGPESAGAKSTSHDSTSKPKWRSRHSIATRTKRSASIVRQIRGSELDAFQSACAFRVVPSQSSNAFSRGKKSLQLYLDFFRSSLHPRTVVLTRHTRARLDVAHAPLSLVLRDQARARQVRRRDSSLRPPPRPLRPRAPSRASRGKLIGISRTRLGTQRGQLAGEDRGPRGLQVHDPRLERLG